MLLLNVCEDWLLLNCYSVGLWHERAVLIVVFGDEVAILVDLVVAGAIILLVCFGPGQRVLHPLGLVVDLAVVVRLVHKCFGLFRVF